MKEKLIEFLTKSNEDLVKELDIAENRDVSGDSFGSIDEESYIIGKIEMIESIYEFLGVYE